MLASIWIQPGQFYRVALAHLPLLGEIRCATNNPHDHRPHHRNKRDNIATLVLNFRRFCIHARIISLTLSLTRHSFVSKIMNFRRTEIRMRALNTFCAWLCACVYVCVCVCRIRVFHSLLTIYSTKAFSIRSEPN